MDRLAVLVGIDGSNKPLATLATAARQAALAGNRVAIDVVREVIGTSAVGLEPLVQSARDEGARGLHPRYHLGRGI